MTEEGKKPSNPDESGWRAWWKVAQSFTWKDFTKHSWLGIAIGVCVGLLLAFANRLIDYRFHHLEQREEIAEDAARNYADQTEIQCSGALLRSFDCTVKVPPSRGPDRQEQYDLSAQQDMAQAAAGQLIVSLVGMGIGLTTLILLWINLGILRKQNADSREMGQRQTRAYLNITSITGEMGFQTVEGQRKWCLSVELAIENTGTTPARNIAVHVRGAISYADEKLNFTSAVEGVQDIAAKRTEKVRFFAWFVDQESAQGLLDGKVYTPEARVALLIDTSGWDVFRKKLDGELFAVVSSLRRSHLPIDAPFPMRVVKETGEWELDQRAWESQTRYYE